MVCSGENFSKKFGFFSTYPILNFLTCSEYAKVAIVKYGAFKGLWLTAKRLLRCHPFCSGGYDPVPAQSKKWQIGDSS